MDASWKGRYHLLVPMHFGGSHFGSMIQSRTGLNSMAFTNVTLLFFP